MYVEKTYGNTVASKHFLRTITLLCSVSLKSRAADTNHDAKNMLLMETLIVFDLLVRPI